MHRHEMLHSGPCRDWLASGARGQANHHSYHAVLRESLARVPARTPGQKALVEEIDHMASRMMRIIRDVGEHASGRETRAAHAAIDEFDDCLATFRARWARPGSGPAVSSGPAPS